MNVREDAAAAYCLVTLLETRSGKEKGVMRHGKKNEQVTRRMPLLVTFLKPRPAKKNNKKEKRGDKEIRRRKMR